MKRGIGRFAFVAVLSAAITAVRGMVPPHIAAPPLTGGWAGREPGSFVEIRERSFGYEPTPATTRATTMPATAPAARLVEKRTRLLLLGRDGHGRPVIQVWNAVPARDGSGGTDWREDSFAFRRPVGFEASRDRGMSLVGFRRETLTVAGRTLPCFVRTYEGQNAPAGAVRVERWTLASTDDERDGSSADGMVVREHLERTMTVAGREVISRVDADTVGIETRTFQGQPITVFRLTVHGTRPGTTPPPDTEWLQSPDLPGYTLSYLTRAVDHPDGVALATPVGSEITSVGIDADLLAQAVRYDNDGAAKQLEFAAARRDRQRQELIDASRALQEADLDDKEIIARLQRLPTVDRAGLGDNVRELFTIDVDLRRLLTHEKPEVRRAAVLACTRIGTKVEDLLLKLCRMDPEGLNTYVQAAARSRTSAVIPVLLQGAKGEWSFVRATAADGLAQIDDPQALAALSELAKDKDASVREALLRTPADVVSPDEARQQPPQPLPTIAQILRATADAVAYDERSPAPLEQVFQHDYREDEWFNAEERYQLRPTAAVGAPGAAIFRRLPTPDVTPTPWWRSRTLPGPLLLTLSRDAQPLIRYLSIFHLADERFHADAVVRARLAEMIDDPDPQVAALAIDVLTRRDAPKPDAALLDRLLAKANVPAPAAEDAPVKPAVNGAAIRGLARLGDLRVVPIAIEALKEPLPPRHGRAISAADALRSIGDEACLDALLSHAADGPNQAPCALALSTLRTERASAWLSARWLERVARVADETTTRPARAATRPATNAIGLNRRPGSDESDDAAPLDVMTALNRGLIRCADAQTIQSLRERAASKETSPALRRRLTMLLDSIEQHRRGR